jgi:hypothetical protein
MVVYNISHKDSMLACCVYGNIDLTPASVKQAAVARLATAGTRQARVASWEGWAVEPKQRSISCVVIKAYVTLNLSDRSWATVRSIFQFTFTFTLISH